MFYKIKQNKTHPISKLKNKVAVISFLTVFVLGIFNVGYSQTSAKFYIPDSLKNYSYEELFEKQASAKNDTLLKKIFASAYLNKAKNENDTINVAKGFTLLASTSSYYDDSLALKYSDSIILLTKDLNNGVYPGFGYMVKGMLYYSLGNYEEALNNYITAQEYAEKHNNIEQLLYIKSSIAELKYFWGNYNEALDIYKSLLTTLKGHYKNQIKNYNQLYFRVLYGLTNSFILTKQLDSALVYSEKGIKKALHLQDSIKYYEFITQSGISEYYNGNYKIAIDSLDKALPFERLENGLLNQHYYRGNIYNKQNDENRAFIHFKKADSIYELSKDVVPEVRDIQEFFVNYYKKRGDITNQLKYIDRLIYVDSILNRNYKNINERIVKEYDTPVLLAEKEKIINSLKKKSNKSRFLNFILSSFALLSILLVIRFYKIQNIYKKRFKKLVQNKEDNKKTLETTVTSEKNSNKVEGISLDVVDSVLDALTKFENEHQYLNNDITLSSLSKSLNTNSNYLSKIINFYKEKNFSNYLSDLRIDYCVEKLKKDSKFRKFAIKAIANEIGFNNTESFSKAFYKKTGIYPSYFIKNLEKLTD